ncbi:MAG: sigma-70 family RNA polymerase sigma factor [Balneolaceae bacterium]
MNSNSLEKEFLERLNKSQGIVHKVCNMYCDNSEDRKDLFQEILIHLWKSYPSFKGDSKFSTWMYRVAFNIAIQYLRKEKKKKEDSVLPEQFEHFHQDVKEEELGEEKRMLRNAIRQLNEVEKAIVMLYLEDRDNEEISDVIGITQNNVRVKMTRIRNKLKDIVEA